MANNNLITTTPSASTIIQPNIPQLPDLSIVQPTPVPQTVTSVSIPSKDDLIKNFMNGLGSLTSNSINQIANDYAQAVVDMANAANNAKTPNADLIYGISLGMLKAAQLIIQALLLMSQVDPDLYKTNLLNMMAGANSAKADVTKALGSYGVPQNTPGTQVGTGFGAGPRGGF